MDTQIDWRGRFLMWAHDTFGDIAMNPRERSLRFLEEAIELAHAMGAEAGTVEAVVSRVYQRPAGNIAREIGQSLATLEMLAKVMGVDANAEASKEFGRVLSVPKEEWERRHAAKVAIGIAS